MQRWKHLTVKVQDEAIIDETLLRYEREGWELVTVVYERFEAPNPPALPASTQSWLMFFKKPYED